MPDGQNVAPPAPAAFDLKGARAAGYSDGEIAGYLGAQSNFNVDEARKAGYNNDEIISHLTAPPPKPEPVSSTLGGMVKAGWQVPTDVAGGLVSAAGDVVTAAGTGVQAIGRNNPATNAARNLDAAQRGQIGLMNRIDAGEAVPAMDDPLGYGDASTEQRAKMRADMGKVVGDMSAPEDTGLGRAGAAIEAGLTPAGDVIKDAGKAVTGVGGSIVKAGEDFSPLTEEEQQRATVKGVKMVGSLVPYIGAAVAGGLPAVLGLAGTQGFGSHYEAAKAAGASDEDAALSGTFGGLATAGMMTLPIGKAMEAAMVLPKALKGEFLASVVKVVESGVTMVGFSQLQKIADNTIAKAAYAPDTSVYKGVGEDMGVEFAAGAILPGIGVAANAGRKLAVDYARRNSISGITVDPNPAAAPVMPDPRVLAAPDVDSAIKAAQDVAKGEPPKAEPSEPLPSADASFNEPDGTTPTPSPTPTPDQYNARGLEAPETRPGGVEVGPDGGYQFRKADAAGVETVSPMVAWNPDTAVPKVGDTTVPPETAIAIRDHYAQAGVNVVFFQHDASIPFDGVVDPSQPDTLFLSNEPSRNVAQVGAHEFTHVLSSTVLPDGTNLGDLLAQQVAAGITPRGQKYAAKMFGSTAPDRAGFPTDAAHAEAVQAHLISELGADIGGEAPKFKTFLPRMIDAIQARFGDSVAANTLSKMLDGMRSAMETMRSLFGETGTRSQHWVTNLGDVHDTLAKMYAERFGSPMERDQVAADAIKDRAARDAVVKAPEAAKLTEPSTTGITEGLGGAGKAIADNMHAALWEKIQAGDTTEAGGPSNLLALAKSVRDQGGLQTREQYDAFAKQVGPLMGDRTEGWKDRLLAAGNDHIPERPVKPLTGLEPASEPGLAMTAAPPAREVTADWHETRDGLHANALQLRRWLGDLQDQRDTAAEHSPKATLLRQTEAAILRPVGGDPSALDDGGKARLDMVRDQIDELTHPTEDTPAMAKVRTELATTAAELVQHTTAKGKILTGTVRTDLDQAGAKKLDPFTFKKDGGWFIRQPKGAVAAPAAKAPTATPPAAPIGPRVFINRIDKDGNVVGAKPAAPKAPHEQDPLAMPRAPSDPTAAEGWWKQLHVMHREMAMQMAGLSKPTTTPWPQFSMSERARLLAANQAPAAKAEAPTGHASSHAWSQMVAGILKTDGPTRAAEVFDGLVRANDLTSAQRGNLLAYTRAAIGDAKWEPTHEVAKAPEPEAADYPYNRPGYTDPQAIAANRIAVDARNGKITKEEAADRLAEMLVRGDIPRPFTNVELSTAQIDRDGPMWNAAIDRATEAAEAAEAPKPEAPQPEPDRPADYGANNKTFTADMAEKARATLRAGFARLNAGFDPTMMAAGFQLAGYHIEAGSRRFAEYAKKMLEDVGDGVRPHLAHFYASVRDYHGFDNHGMDDHATAVAAGKRLMEAAGEKDGTSGLGGDGKGALEGVPAEPLPGSEGRGDVGTSPADGGGPDVQRGELAGAVGSDAAGRLGDGEGRIHPAETGAADLAPGDSGAERDSEPGGEGLRADGGTEQRGAAGADRAELTPTSGITAQDRAPDFAITEADEIGRGGSKAKYKGNVAAVGILRTLDAENRPATAKEQAALAKWVGWGGLPQAFERSDGGASKGWEKEVAALKALLTPEEYRAAQASTRNAHYTSPEVVTAMWDAMRRLGFTGGRLLEPSVGAGNFFGLMPKDLRNTSYLHGVELDRLTGGIAKALYPTARIARMGFQDYTIAPGYFDAVIGNPPFGSEMLYDPRSKALSKFSIHNYFFAKGIDGLAEGGVMAMVVTNRMLDSARDHARSYIAERAALLGAIRLPNNAFAKNAGTEVTTDILFFRKRAPGDPVGEAWADSIPYTDKNGVQVPLNEYFHKHPEMMLGDFGGYGSMYSPTDAALVAREGQDTPALLAAAIARLPENVASVPQAAPPTEKFAPKGDLSAIKVGSMFVEDGKVMLRASDELGETRASAVTFSGETAERRVTGMLGVRDALNTLRALQLSPKSSVSALNAARQALNTVYDRFVKANGPINADANKKLFRTDPTYPQIAALENGFEKGISEAVAKTTGEKAAPPSAKKAAIFSTRTQSPFSVPTEVGSAKDALTASLADKGRVDFPMMQLLYGKPSETITKELGDLVYQDPVKGWAPREEYLSGNVKAKLAQAREASLTDAAYQRNIEALEAVQPKDVEAVDINVKFGAHWLPKPVMMQFAAELSGQGKPSVLFNPASAQWTILAPHGSEAALTQWATKRASLSEVLTAAANQKTITIRDKHEDGSSTLNEKETQLANDKVRGVAAAFNEWVFRDDERRETLGRLYNDTFNTDVAQVYDGSHLTFQGKIDDAVIKLNPHQANAVWRIVTSPGGTLLDHVVGAGKTFTMVAGAMEMRRMGLAKKPVFVVPNHLVSQWAADFSRLYPGASVLATTKEDFKADKRKTLFARIATGDWDAVIVAHSSFGKVEVEPKEQAAFIQEQVADLQKSLEAVRSSEGKDSRNVKQIQKAIEDKTEKMKKLLDAGSKDDSLYWGELGIDALFVDEAHEFKNLNYSTSMQRVAGLGSQAGSNKATDLYLKTRQVMNATGGRNVVFATGTPISNTMAEMFTMQRYLDYRTLKEQGMAHFDAWARMFGEVVTDWELSPSGQYKMNSRFAKFVNMPELMQRYGSFADTVNRDDINALLALKGEKLPIPPVKGGKPENVIVTRSPHQADYIGVPYKDADGNDTDEYPTGSLVWRSMNLPKGPPTKGADNMLKIMSDARKAALDMRLIDPELPDFAGSKVNEAARRIKELYTQWTPKLGTQLVFIDLSTPKGARTAEAERIKDLIAKAEAGDETAQDALDRISPDELTALESKFSVYDDLRQKLINLGIPDAEIEFIHSANTDARKEALFGKVRSGRVRVLLGSTAKMGAGMNVQDKLVALHHLDAPWRPSDLEQREGRIIRQGNALFIADPKNFQIEITRYATKQTLDSRMWQTIESKANFIEQVRRGKGQREAEDIGGEAANSAEMKAAASGNPLILDEMSLRQQIRKLTNERSGHDSDQYRIRDSIRRITSGTARDERTLVTMRQDAALPLPDPFAMTIGKNTLDTREDAGKAVLAAAEKMEADGGKEADLGNYGPFALTLHWLGKDTFSVVATGAGEYETSRFPTVNGNAQGTAIRITNAVSALSQTIRAMEGQIAKDKIDLPKLQGQVKDWPKAGEFADVQARHAAVIDQLKPKRKSADDVVIGTAVEVITGRGTSSPGIVVSERMEDSDGNYTYDVEMDGIVRNMARAGFTVAKPAPGAQFSPRITGAERETEAYTPEQMQMFENVGRITTEPTWTERWKAAKENFWQRAIAQVLDPYIGIKADDPQGYVALRNANSSAGALDRFINGGTLKFNGSTYAMDELNGGVLNNLIRPLQGEDTRFIHWVAAYRAEGLKAEGRENLYSDTDIDTGKKLNLGTVPFDYTLPNGQVTHSREAIYLDSLRKLEGANGNVMELAVESGLIDPDAANEMLKNPYYVPFYREAEEGSTRKFGGASMSGGFVKQTAFKKLKGGTDKLKNDLWGNLLGNWEHMLDASLRNRAAAGVLDVGVTNGVVVERTQREVDYLMTKKEKENLVWVMNAGKKQYFEITDPMLFTAVSALDLTTIRNPAMNLATKGKVALTMGVTLDPRFMLRNAIRDAQQAVAVSHLSYNVLGNVAQGFRMGDLGGALKNVGRAVAGREVEALNLSRETQDAIAGGATMHLSSGHDTGHSKIKVATMLNTPDAITGFWNRLAKVARAAKKVSEAPENVQRFALYNKLISEGVAHDEAAFSARDLQDFTLKGASLIVRALTQIVPFLNASLQGNYKVGRAAANADKNIGVAVGARVAASTTARVAKMLAASTVLMLALDYMFKDDEDAKKRTDDDRNTNYFFKIGSAQFRIPMGFEIAAAARLATNGIEAFAGANEMDAGRFAKSVGSILGNNLSMNPVPQIVRPVVDLYANKARGGRPIVPDSLAKLQPQQQYNQNTTMMARGASTITGGALAPVQVDYLVEAYFGWLGATAIGTADVAVRAADQAQAAMRGTHSLEPVRPSKDLWNFVSRGMVSSEPTPASRYVDLLYKQAETVGQAYATYHGMLATGRGEAARDFVADNRDLLGRHQMLQAATKITAARNNNIKFIENNPDMTAAEKHAEIAKLVEMRNQIGQKVFDAQR